MTRNGMRVRQCIQVQWASCAIRPGRQGSNDSQTLLRHAGHVAGMDTRSGNDYGSLLGTQRRYVLSPDRVMVVA